MNYFRERRDYVCDPIIKKKERSECCSFEKSFYLRLPQKKTVHGCNFCVPSVTTVN